MMAIGTEHQAANLANILQNAANLTIIGHILLHPCLDRFRCPLAGDQKTLILQDGRTDVS